jgi:hypothetical protein
VGGVSTGNTVSACLIVQDEESRVAGALASVAFCDEIVVVDGGSTDATVKLARDAGAKVVENPWPGFARQRNVAIAHASGDWVLEIDADERVTPALAQSIRALVTESPPGVTVGAFAIRNRFLGAMLGPSAKYPQYRFRLFRRDGHFHDESLPVHEGLPAGAGTAVLDGELEHELAGSVREALSDTWSYARLASRHVRRPASPAGFLAGIVLRPAAKLGYRLVLEGGWRDGWRGALKIGLDCASDSLVWLLVLAGRGARQTGAEHAGVAPSGTHVSDGWRAAERPAKVVGVAIGPQDSERAAVWLRGLAARGAEVALLSDQPGGALDGVRVRRIPRLGPLHVLRAMEAERQLLEPDALVAVGGRPARALIRALPARVRGPVGGVTSAQSPEQALERLRAARSS